ncbi:MAG: protein-L-isoaspartate(D-aspartate) O-methyltransferase [Thermoguttaceae bacterium]
MVDEQLRGRDITDPRVLEVMGRLERERFVPDMSRQEAYQDRPVSIGLEQTISQPYIVALMTQLARPSPDSRALDVGSGSGYQAAILAELCGQVYGLEIRRALADAAARRLAALGYRNVAIRCADGYQGWPEEAPFDVILVAAAPVEVPQPLVEQLAVGGRLVIPVGNLAQQDLMLIEKKSDGTVCRTAVVPVQFVRMTSAP